MSQEGAVRAGGWWQPHSWLEDPCQLPGCSGLHGEQSMVAGATRSTVGLVDLSLGPQPARDQCRGGLSPVVTAKAWEWCTGSVK